MARWIWAFLAFNIYSLFLISAFQKNTPYLFDWKLVSELRASGDLFDIIEWGWKDHYIWRVFSGVVVTAIVAFLAGAIARPKGRMIAAIANIPSVLVWGVTAYLMAFGKAEWEGQTGFLVVSVIAIPLTTWLAYHFGGVGAEVQEANFPEETVLGIRPYHWIWLLFPLYFYGLGIVFVFAKFLTLQFLTWRDMSVVGAGISLLSLVPVIAWTYPLTFVYKVLSGESLREKPAGIRAVIVAGVIVGGGMLAIGIQLVSFWLLQKLMSWWY